MSIASLHRQFAVLFLGFASGLPLALTGQAMQAWLAVDGVDIATIGFLGLVGVPYTFKFLWAPLLDRFEPPFLGRRRGWLVLTQLGLAAALVWMASITPSATPMLFAAAAVTLAFLSASQDVVIDAYRTDVLDPQPGRVGKHVFVCPPITTIAGFSSAWANDKAVCPPYRADRVTIRYATDNFERDNHVHRDRHTRQPGSGFDWQCRACH